MEPAIAATLLAILIAIAAAPREHEEENGQPERRGVNVTGTESLTSRLREDS